MASWLSQPSRKKMITLLSAPLPIALSLAAPSLPEIVTLALVLAPAALLALVVAMAGTVNSVSSSARKQQNLTLGGIIDFSPDCFVTNQTKPPFPILNHKQLVKIIPKISTQTLSQQQVDTIVYQVAKRFLRKNEAGK
jgi:hypothetical protein